MLHCNLRIYHHDIRRNGAILKLQAERMEGSNAIARHGPGGVAVNGVEHTQSVVVPWTGEVLNWDVASFDALTAAHFEFLAALKPELVIFGSGLRLRFVKPALLRPLFDARIGVETMDSAAACRTYNVLLAEGRAVIAALIFETQPTPSS
jgi:uncharacterized protein